MQIEERSAGEVMILDLKGKMTLGEGDELLKDKINSLVLQGRKKLILNLEGVPYIDSAGLGEIVRTYTTVSRQGGNLKLLNLTKRISDLLSITKLLTVFETYDSEADPASRRATAAVLFSALRPAEWTKELLVFAGVLFGRRLLDPVAVVIAAATFVTFCAPSGAVYLFSDVADRQTDREHPLKSLRPIASGDLSM